MSRYYASAMSTKPDYWNHEADVIRIYRNDDVNPETGDLYTTTIIREEPIPEGDVERSTGKAVVYVLDILNELEKMRELDRYDDTY